MQLAGIRRGILGHPKFLYNTMLELDEKVLRRMAYDENYDPHGFIKKAFIKIGTADDFVERFVEQTT